jgi:hypothetical protein
MLLDDIKVVLTEDLIVQSKVLTKSISESKTQWKLRVLYVFRQLATLKVFTDEKQQKFLVRFIATVLSYNTRYLTAADCKRNETIVQAFIKFGIFEDAKTSTTTALVREVMMLRDHFANVENFHEILDIFKDGKDTWSAFCKRVAPMKTNKPQKVCYCDLCALEAKVCLETVKKNLAGHPNEISILIDEMQKLLIENQEGIEEIGNAFANFAM